MTRLNATTVSSRELHAAGTWSPSEVAFAEDGVSCRLCGLRASTARRRGPGGVSRGSVADALLVTESVPAWVVRLPTYRCRDERACAGRVTLA